MTGALIFLGCYFAIGLFLAVGVEDLPVHKRANLFAAWPLFLLEVLRARK